MSYRPIHSLVNLWKGCEKVVQFNHLLIRSRSLRPSRCSADELTYSAVIGKIEDGLAEV